MENPEVQTEETPLQTKQVFQAGQFGFYLYPTDAHELPLQRGSFNIPYGAFEDEPEPAPAGMVNKRVFADEHDAVGAWTHVDDNREAVLYVVGKGVQYTIGSQIDVDGTLHFYDGGGPVPIWLTTEAPPPVEPETPALPSA